MHQRWRILLALTAARASMGLQFQAIPALALPLSDAGLSYTAIGTLAGAYLLPGVVAALGGGWLGSRFGDIRVALWGLALMVLGGAIGLLSLDFGVQLAGRIVSGAGAVALNVMVTKMAGDWFEGRGDLTTAMGILVSSWPAGIALAMLVLPGLAAGYGLTAALVPIPLVCLAALAGLAAIWAPAPAPDGAPARPRPAGIRPDRRELALISVAGGIWGLYNVAFIGALAWSAGLLAGLGLDDVEAARRVSLMGWTAGVSVALGGWIVARFRVKDVPGIGFLLASGLALIAFAAALPGVTTVAFLLALGFLLGPSAAVIMSLTVEATRPASRAVSMGVYFALYYVVMGIAPTGLGWLVDRTGDPAAPILAAVACLVACLALWALFRALIRRPAPQPSA